MVAGYGSLCLSLSHTHTQSTHGHTNWIESNTVQTYRNHSVAAEAGPLFRSVRVVAKSAF